MRRLAVTLAILGILLFLPLASLAKLDLNNSEFPLPDLNSLEELKNKSTEVASLWSRFDGVITRINDWFENEAGIQIVGILKGIGKLFIVVAKWMITFLEFLLAKL